MLHAFIMLPEIPPSALTAKGVSYDCPVSIRLHHSEIAIFLFDPTSAIV